MKKKIIFLLFCFILFISSYSYAGYVKPHLKKNGTYVLGYQRSNKNKTKLDNYSTKGNVNPYTGKKGYKKLYKTKSLLNK